MKITKFTFESFSLNPDDVCLSNACIDYTIHNYPQIAKRTNFAIGFLACMCTYDVCACPKMRWVETLFQAKFENIAKLKWS
jgi:hypothetical protein